ncbi:MAG: hypothetical protein GY906_22935 [bacterium]|nr:hypothetical protein [bacterium]
MVFLKRWLQRWRAKRAGYPANCLHVYCYHCQGGETQEGIEHAMVRVKASIWAYHADEEQHIIQLMIWTEVPKWFGRGMCSVGRVIDSQYIPPEVEEKYAAIRRSVEAGNN